MPEMTLVIGNKNYSSWSLRPWLYLKHFGFSFEEVHIDLYAGDYKSKILAYSPSGKVPFLRDGELGIWDSLAILEYLAETYPEQRGWPADPTARAAARSVSAEMHSGFFALREHLPMNCRKLFTDFVPPENAVRDIDRVKEIWRYCRGRFGAGGPWLFGEFSIADCMFAPVVMRFHTYSVAVSETEKRYLDTVKQHPAMVEWIAASHEEQAVIASSEITP